MTNNDKAIAALRAKVEGMKKEPILLGDNLMRVQIRAHNNACDQFLRILDEVIGRAE